MLFRSQNEFIFKVFRTSGLMKNIRAMSAMNSQYKGWGFEHPSNIKIQNTYGYRFYMLY